MSNGPGALPTSCCYYGTGRVLLAPWNVWQAGWTQQFDPFDAQGNIAPLFRDVGEASRLDLDVRSKSASLPRYDGLGGEQCATEQLDGVDLTLGIDCLDNNNLLLAFAGTQVGRPGSAEVDPLPAGIVLTRLSMLTQAARTQMAVLFEGRNAVDGSGRWVFMPKVKFALAKSRRFITEEFGEVTLTGKLLHAGDAGLLNSPWWDEIVTT